MRIVDSSHKSVESLRQKVDSSRLNSNRLGDTSIYSITERKSVGSINIIKNLKTAN